MYPNWTFLVIKCGVECSSVRHELNSIVFSLPGTISSSHRLRHAAAEGS